MYSTCSWVSKNELVQLIKFTRDCETWRRQGGRSMKHKSLTSTNSLLHVNELHVYALLSLPQAISWSKAMLGSCFQTLCLLSYVLSRCEKQYVSLFGLSLLKWAAIFKSSLPGYMHTKLEKQSPFLQTSFALWCWKKTKKDYAWPYPIFGGRRLTAWGWLSGNIYWPNRAASHDQYSFGLDVKGRKISINQWSSFM